MTKKNNVNKANKNSSNVYGIIGGAIATVVGVAIVKKIIDRRPTVDDSDQDESDDKVDSSAVNDVDDRSAAYKIAAEVKTIINKINGISTDMSFEPVIRVPMHNSCVLLRELDALLNIIDIRLTTEFVSPVVTPEIQAEFNRLLLKSRTLFDDIQYAKLLIAADSVSNKIQNMHDDGDIAHFNEQLGKLLEKVSQISISDSTEEVNETLTSFDNLSKEVDSYISNHYVGKARE